MKMKILLICVSLVLINVITQCIGETIPSYFRLGDFYPRKGQNDPRKSEVKSSGAIRDVIKRNSPRYRKVLVRNSNNEIDFQNEDCRYMTSRAKSKLDILGSLVRSRLGDRLYVKKAWTDNVNKQDILSLHYEGRAFEVRLSRQQNERALSDLAKTAMRAGFDWVHFEDRSFIHISVVPDVCQTKLDLAVVVDTSGSVGRHNFNTIQKFLKDLVDFFNVGRDETHIALVSYSYSVKVEFGLTSHYSKSSLKDAINRMWYQGSNTRTGDALMALKRNVFRAGNGVRNDKAIPKIGILMTDGRSNGGTSVSHAANEVKNLGINMFVIGITNNPRQSEINVIASKPVQEHYFKINGFNDLSSFVDQISSKSCDEGAQIGACENANTAVDGGSFKYFRVQLKNNVERVSVEVTDIRGRSFLYTSLKLQNPGPLSDDHDVEKNEQIASPRTVSVPLPRTSSTNILYIAVQGQLDTNEFSISIWDSLFPKDKDGTTVQENKGSNTYVTTVRAAEQWNAFHYTIKSGDHGHFSINKQTGEIRTRVSLDRENIPSYQLSIVAQDQSEICHKGLMVFEVTVGDDNDNKPKFEKSYQASVPENPPSNQYVIQVKATDKDTGINAQLYYEISGPSQFKDVFRIDSNTGVVYTTSKPLDYETKSSYDLELKVRDRGNPQLSDTTRLVISIIDVNEPPRFTSPACLNTRTCLYTIEEEGNAGKQIKDQIKATDPDTKQQCTLKYYLVSLDKQYFRIGETTGIITTKVPLDRELKEQYSLDIEVRDCGQLSARTTIRVQAKDINDNDPIFSYPNPLKIPVIENFPTNKIITTFTATDADKGTNAQIEYTISDNKGNNQFTINKNNGQLSLVKSLDREQKNSHVIIITAMDKGTPNRRSSSMEVQIKVEDVNDNRPQFKGSKSATVYENVQRKTKVMTVVASDLDEGFNAKIRYSIIGGNTGSMFRIDGNSGVVSTNNIPDREAIDRYSLKIRAEDYGRPSLQSDATYTITIQDKNDNSPIFRQSNYVETIKENTAINKEVLKVSATDRDIGINAQMEFSLESTGHNNFFVIHKDTGSITLVKPLDFGTKNYFQFRVKATDKGVPSLTGYATVKITISDSNDFDPKFSQSPYNVNLEENVRRGHKVTEVKATDDDSGPSGDVTYSITKQDPENRFYIDSSSGSIYTYGSIDYEKKKSYTVTVRAIDNGKPSRQATSDVNIKIIDLNDNAPTFDDAPFDVSEDHGVNVQIKQLIGSDKDSGKNAQFDFSLVTSNTPFVISSSGVISIKSGLDREQTDSYALTVRITDRGTNPSSLTTQKVIKINILDVNDNIPKLTQNPFKCSVPENSPGNTFVCRTTASDLDIGENARITYSLTGDNKFKINQNNGEIRTTNPLDRETKDTYSLVVTATDNGKQKLFSSATVQVTVTDVNDNQPKFSKLSYSFIINEEKSDGTKVGEMEASDLDIGKNAELSFSIVKGHVYGSRTMFTVTKENNKAILRANRLDREQRDKYILTVRVEDGGNPRLSTETTVTVVVDDINDNNPVLTQERYYGKIKENVGINTLVLKLEATDRDIGKNAEIVYTIVGGKNQDHFQLNPSSGEFRTAKKLDYETITKYEFDVKAEDKGTNKLKDTAKVVIDVINVDDNAPEFEKVKLLELPEDLGVGQPCVQFKAQDKDGSDIKYSITGGNQEDKFSLNEKTALLSVKNSLDRETTDKYNLSVTATDSSSSTVIYVPVKILDINDNTPIFDKNEYTKSVQEDASPLLFASPVLLTVKATDRDLGKNAEIEYFISSGNVGDKFQISPDTGAIRATGKLDREQVSSYSLSVTAKDKGTPSLDKTVTVKITITDVNDNRPQFEQSSYSTSIYENTSPNSKILDIRASDADAGDNGRVGYKIKSGDSKTFSIDPNTGELKTIKALDREQVSSYKLIIEASDFGKPTSLSSTVEASITILDINDNTPIIKKPIQITPVNESAKVGFNLGQIIATDADIGVNKELEYGLIEEGNNDFFDIDQNTGVVTLKKMLDRETSDQHKIRFTVKDKGVPVLSTFIDHVVQVLDENDNAPKFKQDAYKGSLDEELTAPVTLFTAEATDLDIGENAVIVYTLVDNKGGIFQMNPQTGVLKAVKPIDYEKTTSYDLQIKASDWKFSSTVNAKITVRNINDNSPIFNPASYKKTIPEGTPRRTVVRKVSATDKDPFGNLVYSMKSGNRQHFDINSRTGEIYVTGELDRETKDFYKFVVSVADNGKTMKTADADVEITLSDINDNRPIFSLYNINANITENEKPGKVILTVNANDRDIGKNAEIRYRVKPGQDDSEFEIGLKDGVIKTKKTFDREKQTEAEFIFQAYDLGNPTMTSKDVVMKVKILDENDNTPEWKEKDVKASVEEHAANGTQIKTVIATDADEGENGRITYSIQEKNSLIAIDQNTGLVTVLQDIDRETTPSFTVTLVATDNGKIKQLSSKTTLSITVLDINDNTPEIKPPLSGSVFENEPAKTSIMKIVADDKDIGKNAELTFSLENFLDLFTLDSKTGLLKTNKPLDREEKDRYYLTVSVRDAGTPSRKATANITILIKDIDDNCPVFERTEYNARLEENAPPGTYVVTVKATDRDEGANAELDYGILEGNDKGAFTVDSDTGVVTVIGEVNKEGVERYFIKVRAGAKDCGVKLNDSDVGEGGKPQASNYTYAIVYISVDDVNDNAPIFLNGKDKITYDNINETFIYQLQATDKDEGLGGQVKYELREQVQKLSDSKEIEYHITVRAYDQGIKSLFSDKTIIIVNKFQCNAMKFSINEDTGVVKVKTLCTVKNEHAGPKEIVISSDITLTCNAQGNSNPIIYQWIKDGDVVSIEDETNGQLVLKNVNHEHEGGYSCVARNLAGSLQSETTNLVILEPPSIITQPKPLTVGQEEKFTLQVIAHGKPEPSYQWYKNDKSYDTATSNKFEIESAILADSAQYHCIVSNGVGEPIKTKKVAVKVFDQTTVVKVNVKVNRYDPKLKCHHFFPEDFEKTASGVVSDRVLVTKVTTVGKSNITICNRTACSKNPCLNDGECSLSGDGSYQCTCKAEWTGKNCENDVNECTLASLCTDAGTCQNLNGSFSCKCPVGLTGRRCEYKSDVCKPFPCQSEENCVPTEDGDFSCVKKSNEVTLVIDSSKLLEWNKNKKQTLEHFLNQILKTSQKATPVTLRRRRKRRSETSSFDFGECTVHIIQNKIINSTKTEVKLALDCGNETNSDVLKQVCSILLQSSVPSTSIEQCGTKGQMTKVEKTKTPSAEAEVNIVVEKSNGKALGAKEATDLLKSKDFSEKVSTGGNFEVKGVTTAYPKYPKEEDNNTTIIVIAVVAVIIVAAIIAGFVVYKRRGSADIKQSHVMSQRSAMTPAGLSTSELVPRVEVMSSKDNMAYEGNDELNTNDGTFMFEMPTGLKSSNATEKKEDNILDIGWYHGNMSKSRAESLLSKCSEPGTFLLYTNPEQNPTFAVRTPTGTPYVRHFSLKKNNGKYTAQPGTSSAVTFDSINMAMEHYSVHAVSFEENEPDIILKEPLLKSAL